MAPHDGNPNPLGEGDLGTVSLLEKSRLMDPLERKVAVDMLAPAPLKEDERRWPP